jgi:hypothetical protein
MDKYIYERMDVEWLYEYVDGWKDEWLDRLVVGWIHEWKDGWLEDWLDGQNNAGCLDG